MNKPNKEKTVKVTCESCMRVVEIKIKKGEKVGHWICPDCHSKNCNT